MRKRSAKELRRVAQQYRPKIYAYSPNMLEGPIRVATLWQKELIEELDETYYNYVNLFYSDDDKVDPIEVWAGTLFVNLIGLDAVLLNFLLKFTTQYDLPFRIVAKLDYASDKPYVEVRVGKRV